MGSKTDTAFLVAAIVGTVAMVLLPVVTTILWNTWKSQTDAVKANAAAQTLQTIALEKLKTEIEFIWKESRKIPELEKDVQGWHGKVRELESVLRRNNLT